MDPLVLEDKVQSLAPSNNTNQDDLKNKQMDEILANDSLTNDNIVFLRLCIKNFSSQSNYKWLEGQLEEDELKELVKHMKFIDVPEKDNQIYQTNEFTNIPLYMLHTGSVTIWGRQAEKEVIIKKYQTNELVYIQPVQILPCYKAVKVELGQNTTAFTLDRLIFESFRKTQINRQRDLMIGHLGRSLPRFKMADVFRQETLLKLFTEVKKQQGSVISVPRAGTSDLFILTEGTVVIFCTNSDKCPINKHYDKSFIVIGCHKNQGIMNESRILFEQESNYGCIVVGGEATLHTLDKNGLQLINDNQSISDVRDEFVIKNQQYKNLLQEIKSLGSLQEVQEIQQKICAQYSLDFEEITKHVLKNTKMGVIEQTDRQDQLDKNLQLFNMKTGNNPMKSALLSMTDRERTLCLGTPRIVQQNTGIKGMSAQQETSLFALRQLGTNIRKGTQITNSILPMGKDDIQRARKALMEEERASMIDLTNRKSIGDKKLLRDNEESKETTGKQFESSSHKKIDLEGKAREDFDVKVDITVDLHQEQKIAESTKDADQKQPITQTQRQVEIAEKRKSLMKLGI